MIEQAKLIIEFIVQSFIHIWPYLIITIPIAVAVSLTDSAKYISRIFQGKPIIAILLAVLVGAFSPFCSCGVIPVVASLLIGGVPLAPVMSFWIASPSMDPEIFFLSVGALGWELAIWRLLATLIISLMAGFVTHFAMRKKWLGKDILKTEQTPRIKSLPILMKKAWYSIKTWSIVRPIISEQTIEPALCCGSVSTGFPTSTIHRNNVEPYDQTLNNNTNSCEPNCESNSSYNNESQVFASRLVKETLKSTNLVVKFMFLAFFLGALITLYVPENLITNLLGGQSSTTIMLAAIFGIPVYTSNLTALPLIGGLLNQGMNPAAALAFLVSGPMTTIPAMAAVWGLVSRRVFLLYVSFALFGAIIFGMIYNVL